jgi:hypothetical protein
MKLHITLPRQQILVFMFFASVAAIMIAPFSFKSGIPDIMDYFNHLVGMIEAKMAFAQGQFPLRIAPQEQSQWGYPFFQFYAPSAYTFAAIVYRFLSPLNPLTAYDLSLWIALIVGGIYMYRLSYCLVKSRPAAGMSSIVYLASPYYMIVINHMCDLIEGIALGVIPVFIFYAIKRFQNPWSIKTFCQLSLVTYLLATIHVISFVYTSMFTLTLLFLMTLKNFNLWKNFLSVIVSYVFAWLLAAWFFAPVLLYKKYLNIEAFYGNLKDFDRYQISWKSLFYPFESVITGVPNHQGLIDSILQVHPNIGVPILFAALVCVYIVVKNFSQKNVLQNRAQDFLPSLLVLFFASIIMILSPFNFWHYLPKAFLVCQYSWRMLAQTIWIGALLFAIAMSYMFKNKLKMSHAAGGIFIILLAGGSWFATPERNYLHVKIPVVASHPQLLWNANAYGMNEDKIKYLARDTSFAYSDKLDPKQTDMYCSHEGSSVVCQVEAQPTLLLIELPQLYYPDLLSITDNGQPVFYTSVLYRDRVVAAIAPKPGGNTIRMRFRGVVWANQLSQLAWGFWLLLFLFGVIKAFTPNFRQTCP